MDFVQFDKATPLSVKDAYTTYVSDKRLPEGFMYSQRNNVLQVLDTYISGLKNLYDVEDLTLVYQNNYSFRDKGVFDNNIALSGELYSIVATINDVRNKNDGVTKWLNPIKLHVVEEGLKEVKTFELKEDELSKLFNNDEKHLTERIVGNYDKFTKLIDHIIPEQKQYLQSIEQQLWNATSKDAEKSTKETKEAVSRLTSMKEDMTKEHNSACKQHDELFDTISADMNELELLFYDYLGNLGCNTSRVFHINVELSFETMDGDQKVNKNIHCILHDSLSLKLREIQSFVG